MADNWRGAPKDGSRLAWRAEGGQGWVSERLKSSLEGRQVRGDGVLYGVGVICLVMLASDFVQPTNKFWSQHQLVTGVVTGALLALLAAAGLDRLLAVREARRWKPLGLLIVDRFNQWVDQLEDISQSHVLGYCLRAYGDFGVPAGRDYLEMFVEALGDPETWREDDSEVPGLIGHLAEAVVEAESDLETWAPLLLADSRLTEIGTCAISILDLTKQSLVLMQIVSVTVKAGTPPNYGTLRRPVSILELLLVYRVRVARFKKLVQDYRGSGSRGGPIVPDQLFWEYLEKNGYAASAQE